MPQQLDPNAYPRQSCHGFYMNKLCDGAGLFPVEENGVRRLYCRLCYYRYKIDNLTCESEKCNNQARHLYFSKSCVEGKYLCDCCYSRQMILRAYDLALREQSQEASA